MAVFFLISRSLQAASFGVKNNSKFVLKSNIGQTYYFEMRKLG